MSVSELNKDKFNLLLYNLDYAEEKIGDELNEMNKIHPKAVKTKNSVMNIQNVKHYSNKNITLYNQLQEEFAAENMMLDCFYKFKYEVGDYANPHLDSYSNQTTLLLLSDEFTGGEFILEGTDINFNKKGTFVTFNSKKEHSVSKVLSGYREVLVMLFRKKKTML